MLKNAKRIAYLRTYLNGEVAGAAVGVAFPQNATTGTCPHCKTSRTFS